MPLPDKVEAIKNIAVLTSKKYLRTFIGLINYNRHMWQHRSEILAPLSSMTSKQAKWNWSKECQKVFESIKKLGPRESKLSFPNFNEPYVIHWDASKVQIASLIS